MTLKKYLPYIVLAVAATILLYVKQHQRGKRENVTIDAPSSDESFRKITSIQYSKHAKCRMDCRHIDETEVKEILANGTVNYSRVQQDERGKTYPLEGITHDKQHVRIVVAPKTNELVIVTVIDLDTDYPCECK
jgi:hypothetical protein